MCMGRLNGSSQRFPITWFRSFLPVTPDSNPGFLFGTACLFQPESTLESAEVDCAPAPRFPIEDEFSPRHEGITVACKRDYL